MLNYLFDMLNQRRTLPWLLIALLSLAGLAATGRQDAPTPTPPAVEAAPPAQNAPQAILAPANNTVLQGVAPVMIHTDVPGFQAAELTFAYAGDLTGTWFLLYESTQPLAGGVAVEWDTATITDGDYTLRLTIALADGSVTSVQATGLRVRNYSAAETDTPAPPPPPVIPEATVTPAAAPSTGEPTGEATPPATEPVEPTASATLPPADTPETPPASPAAANPAELAPAQVRRSVARGGLAALSLFALAGIYWSLRRLGKRNG